jgi:hypothetical protein
MSEQTKPKILVSVLCGRERTHWINPLLFDYLVLLPQDQRFAVFNLNAYDFGSYQEARNTCMVRARDFGADALVMIDNDINLPPYFSNILHQSIINGRSIVNLPAAVLCGRNRQPHEEAVRLLSHDVCNPDVDGLKDGDYQEVKYAGTGVMIVSSEVWRVIPRGPWFKTVLNDNEVLSPKLGEDYYFCELAAEHGLKVWSHTRALAGHLKTTDLTEIVKRFEELKR